LAFSTVKIANLRATILQYYDFMLDSDDFFTPWIPKRKLKYYTFKFFKDESRLATGKIKWLNYCNSPDLSKVPSNAKFDSNLKRLQQNQKEIIRNPIIAQDQWSAVCGNSYFLH